MSAGPGRPVVRPAHRPGVAQATLAVRHAGLRGQLHRVHPRHRSSIAADRPAPPSDRRSGHRPVDLGGGHTFRVGWWTAWRAITTAAQAVLDARPLTPPARLGVDETTFRRPQRFMTGLIDLDTGRLWDLVEGRSKAVLANRLRALGPAVGLIEHVVIGLFGFQ